jgi:hypothetical protein
MDRKLIFEDDSSIEISIVIQEEGKMSEIALQRLTEFLEEELLMDPRLTLQEASLLELEEEDLGDLELDEDDEWLEDEEELDEGWEDEDDEDLGDLDDWADDEVEDFR